MISYSTKNTLHYLDFMRVCQILLDIEGQERKIQNKSLLIDYKVLLHQYV